MDEMSAATIYDEARKTASSFIGLSDSRYVVLGRNATEASSVAFWLAQLKPGDEVIVSNAEHDSVKDIFLKHQDHGNDKLSHNKSSWPRWYFQEREAFEPTTMSHTNVTVKTFNVNKLDSDSLREELSKVITPRTKAIILSHVRRYTGQALPVNKITSIARKLQAPGSSLFVLIDGTQALGNLAKVDIKKIDCNAYSASPHKTMNSEVLGLLYLNPSKINVQLIRSVLQGRSSLTEQKIPRGMLSERLGVEHNSSEFIPPADVAGFNAAAAVLKKRFLVRNNDFTSVFKARRGIRKYFRDSLRKLQPFSMSTSLVVKNRQSKTPFIENIFPLIGDTYSLAQSLSDRKIFVTATYDKADLNDRFLRVSFQPDTTKKEIDYSVSNMQDIFSNSRMAWSHVIPATFAI